MATDYRSKTQRIGILQQSKTSNHWDAVQPTTANFYTTNYDMESVIPDPDVQIDEFGWTAQAGQMTEEGRIYTDYKTGISKYPFTSTAVKPLLAQHLVAVMQSVVEGASTPYPKTFTFNDNVIDFSNNGGYLWTVVEENINGQDGILMRNAMLDTLTLSCDMGARGMDRLMKMNGTWFGIRMVPEQNFTGSWVAPPLAPFYGDPNNSPPNPFILVDLSIGTDIFDNACLRSWEITINNNLTPKCITTYPGNYNIAQEMFVTLRFWKNSVTHKAFQGYQIGDNIEMNNANGGLYDTITVGTDGHLGFNSLEGHITENPLGFEAEYQTIDVTFKVDRPIAGWSPVILMSDAIDGGY